MRNIALVSAKYVLVIASFFCIFMLSFKSQLFADDPILFYRGIKLLMIVFLIYACAIVFARYKQLDNIESYVAALCIGASISLSFFVLVPVTVDRSISTFVLSQFADKSSSSCSNGLSEKDIKKYFLENYVNSQDAIGRRLKEQAATGSIKREGSCWVITPKGKSLHDFFFQNKNYFSR